jgi:hypothetical protein
MVQVYFNKIQNIISDLIEQSQIELKIAVAWFTNEYLFKIVLDKLKKGVRVTLIILDDETNNGHLSLNFQEFIDSGGNLFYSKHENPMHNKFCVIDSSVVFTGSYNWTYNAEYKNYENLVVFKNIQYALQYCLEFERIIQYLMPVKIAIKYSTYNSNNSNILKTNDYISNDIVIRALLTNSPYLLKEALALSPNLNVNNAIVLLSEKSSFRMDDKVKNDFIKLLMPRPPPPPPPPPPPNREQGYSSIKVISSILDSSFGIRTARSKEDFNGYTLILSKGISKPCFGTLVVGTLFDDQVSMIIETYMGEDAIVSKNQLIGKIVINDLPKLAAGQATVKIDFSHNETNIIDVKVQNMGIGNFYQATYYI